MKPFTALFLILFFVTSAQALQCSCDYTYEYVGGNGATTMVRAWTQCPSAERWDLDCRAYATPTTLTSYCRNFKTFQEFQNTYYIGGASMTPKWGSCTLW